MDETHSTGDPSPRTLTREIHEITDPLLRLPQNIAAEDRVSASLQHVLAEAGPRQAEVLRRCAVPRWFDAGVLAVLRDRTDGNEALLDVLDGYSFVRRVNHARYGYHDVVRAILLKEWRAERPEQLRELNLQLAAYFQARAVTHAPQPLPGMPEGSSKTLRVVAASTSTAGSRELYMRESLYHLLQADPQAGLMQLRAEFEQADDMHRLGDAEALVQLAAEAPLDDSQQLWVRYMQARVNSMALRLDPAATGLRDLIDTAQEPLLVAKARQTLGEVYAETGRWVQASELYRASLSYFQANTMREDAALVMLRLGEAYQEIARNSGGWHVYAYPQSPFWRKLGEGWNTLLAWPFALVVLLLGAKRYDLPRPRYLASYQNWLLTRLYRTAQRWFERAQAAYMELGEQEGVVRAEQRQAEILTRFGFHQEALVQFDSLKARVPASDVYAHAWLDRDRAFSLVALDDLPQAQTLIDSALAAFSAIGDVRREASVLALQSYAALRAGHEDAALAGYQESLERFRKLHYVAAREQVLYDLRAWRRRIGDSPRAEQIDALIAAEPEKRYVARFPRSQRPLLQFVMLAWLPLALLLVAVFAPQIQLISLNRLALLTTYYDPWTVLTVLLLVGLSCLVAYTAIAFGVFYVLPIDAIKREQPDVIVTDPEGITRYDAHGDPIARIGWRSVQQWVTADFRLWHLPLPLFSTTLVASADNDYLVIDGITGWYSSVQCDIKHHLAAADTQAAHVDADINVLQSKMGVLFVVGLLLLPVMISVENGWSMWLLALLSPPFYALAALVTFSGALVLVPMAYWLATRPLMSRRRLGMRDAWPAVVLAVGILSMALGIPDSNQIVRHVPALGVGMLLWGAYLFADGVTTYLAPRETITRWILIAATLCVVGIVAVPTALTIYLDKHNQSIQQRVELAANGVSVSLPMVSSPQSAQATEQLFATSRLFAQPYLQSKDIADSFSDQASTQYVLGNYRAAADAFDQALVLYRRSGDIATNQPLRQAYASALYNRGRTQQQLGQQDGWRKDRADACQLYAAVAADCSTDSSVDP